MRSLLSLAIAVALLSCSGSSAWGAITVSTTDLWQGATVTANSPVLGPPLYSPSFASDIRNLFGGAFGTVEIGNTLFQDFQAPGTLHFVNWQTSAAITLRSFVLIAAHDGPPRNINHRGFTTFRLLADTDSSGSYETTIFQLSPSNPYGNTPAPPNGLVETNPGLNVLSLAVNVAPTLSQRFRAEFIQAGPGSTESGPRIAELDGFDTFRTDVSTPNVGDPIPEPTSIAAWLIVCGACVWPRWRSRVRA